MSKKKNKIQSPQVLKISSKVKTIQKLSKTEIDKLILRLSIADSTLYSYLNTSESTQHN